MTAPTVDHGFEAERPRLLGVAYRITGSRAEADDVVQDAWLRWQRTERGTIERPAAWLTTVTSRLALDRLRSAQRRRETYVGPWLPDPVATEPGPAATAEMAESLSLGFLTVLERLAPVERVVFLLADVFNVPFAEIAEVVDRSPTACRQVASRARQRVRDGRPRFSPTDAEAWRVTEAFLGAVAVGDIGGVVAVLAPDVIHLSDGGPDHHAARRPVVGPDRVARLVVNLAARHMRGGVSITPCEVNGQPGVVVEEHGRTLLAMACSVVDGRIERVWAVVNPEKTAAIHRSPLT